MPSSGPGYTLDEVKQGAATQVVIRAPGLCPQKASYMGAAHFLRRLLVVVLLSYPPDIELRLNLGGDEDMGAVISTFPFALDRPGAVVGDL
jgi:hypothetical protein